MGYHEDHSAKILGLLEHPRSEAHASRSGISQRRSRALFGVARVVLHYRSMLAMKDKPVESAMKVFAA